MALVDRLTLYAAQIELARRSEQIEKDVSNNTLHSIDSLKSFARLYTNAFEATSTLERWEKKNWCKESWLRDSVAMALMYDHTSDSPTWMMKNRDVYRPWRKTIVDDICNGTSKVASNAIVDAIVLYPAFIPADLVPRALSSLKDILPSTKILKPLLAAKVGMITSSNEQTEIVDAYQNGYAGELEKTAKEEIAKFCAAATRIAADKLTPKAVRDRIKELSTIVKGLDLTPLVTLDLKVPRKSNVDLQPALKLCQESLWQVFVTPEGRKAIPVEIQIDLKPGEIPNTDTIKGAKVLVISDKTSRSGTTQRGGTFYTIETLATLIGAPQESNTVPTPSQPHNSEIDLSTATYASPNPTWRKSEEPPSEEIFKIPTELRIPSRQVTEDNLRRATAYLKSYPAVKFTDPDNPANNSGLITSWQSDQAVKIKWNTQKSEDATKVRVTTTVRGVLDLAYDLQWGLLKIIE